MAFGWDDAAILAASAIGSMAGGQGGMDPEDQLLEQYKMQKEFAMHGLEWRADDARKAGLHPMAALGTQGASFQPVGLWNEEKSGGLGKAIGAAGQAYSDYKRGQKTPEQRAMETAQLKVLQAQAENDFAQASYWSSQAAKNAQSQSSAAPAPGAGFGPDAQSAPVHISRVEGHPLTYDHVKIKPDEQISARSADRSVSSATNPAHREYVWRSGPGGDTKVTLPYSDEGPVEALESTPIWMYPQLIRDNIKRYGHGWLYEFLGLTDPGNGKKNWEVRKRDIPSTPAKPYYVPSHNSNPSPRMR